ncbi:hypothetical protein C807_01507 [Lachnospiraceae bacterium 28-4]|jgi:uncharacterized membrane protein YhiD involved in acid resistance|nr:hypothetical protein C807_01507 [Lachnospiraceae bacterium 28-4]
MSYSDIIKKSVLEGFSYADFSTTKMAVTLGLTFLIAVYIFFVYRFITRSTFYNKNFNITMAIISVVTAGIVIAMQSNFVISLGMVGALSIVRFRTAIKEPMDLLFLFWSIGTGIMCGAGLYELAIVIALVVTFGLLVLQLVPVMASPMLLVIKLNNIDKEETVLSTVKKSTQKYKIDSKSITNGRENLIMEIRVKDYSSLTNEISKIEGVVSVTLMHHEGEVKN